MNGTGRIINPKDQEREDKSFLLSGNDDEDGDAADDYECGIVGKETSRERMSRRSGNSLRISWFHLAAGACLFFTAGFIFSSMKGSDKESSTLAMADVRTKTHTESVSIEESPPFSSKDAPGNSFGQESQIEYSSNKTVQENKDEKGGKEVTMASDPTDAATLSPTASNEFEDPTSPPTASNQVVQEEKNKKVEEESTVTSNPTIAPTSSEAESQEEKPLISSSTSSANQVFQEIEVGKTEGESIMTSKPTKPPSTASNEEDETRFSVKKEEMVIHVVFDDLHYRRVCAPVHSSVLCLTVRFPFEVPEQDPAKDFPFPVDDRMYTLQKNKVGFVDGEDLEECKQKYENLSIDETVKACLENMASKQLDANYPLALWTRFCAKGDARLYGINSPEQQRRIEEYFENEMILLFGASPSPGIAACISGLFRGCYWSGIKPGVNVLCKGRPMVRLLGNTNTWSGLAMDETFIGASGYYPADISHGRTHDLPGHNITELFRAADMDRNDTKTLRKLTIVSEYPIAHAQNQNMIFEEMEKVERIQDGFPKLMLDAGSELGRKELAELGYDVQRIIAYDGLPQFNPTITGAYDWAQKASTNEEKFLENQGYPGWKPEYGSTCRGPLLPTSKLKEVNQLAYNSFKEKGMDMRFYGRTWEFTNLFWYGTGGWGDRGLDCTHAAMGSGMYCMHKFFLMAMVDDEYDTKQ